MRAVGSPRVPAKRRAKGQDLSAPVGDLFTHLDEGITPVPISNDRQVTKAIHQILVSYRQSTDWSGRLECVTKATAIVKGGAPNFISFVHQVDKLSPILSDCILSLRSTLVKAACRLIAQLSQNLREQYSNAVLPLIPILFKPTQNGTQIISDSCKLAILGIAQHCQSRKVIQAIIDANSSRSAVQRTVVANSIFLIVNSWDTQMLIEAFGLIEKVLFVLLADPAPDARQLARDAFRRLSELFPDKSQHLYSRLDTRQRSSLEGSAPKRRRAASVETRRRPPPSNSSLVVGQESDYVGYVQQLILQGETEQIADSAAEISKNLMAVMADATPSVLFSALSLLDDLLGLIPHAFSEYVSHILKIVLRPVEHTQNISRRVLNILAARLPGIELMQTALSYPDSALLVRFVGSLLQAHPEFLTRDNAARVLSLCCFADDRTLATRIRDEFCPIFNEFFASANATARRFLAPLRVVVHEEEEEDAGGQSKPSGKSSIVTEELVSFPPRDEHHRPEVCVEPRIQRSIERAEVGSVARLLQRLSSEIEKGPIIRRLSAYLTAMGGRGFEAVLPQLVWLSRGRFAAEAERGLQAIGGLVDSPELLDAAVPLLDEATDPAAAVQFLTRVVACAPMEVLAPIVPAMLGRLTPLLGNEVAEVRKSAVLCIVEVRIVIGEEFDAEISRLRNVPRKLVLHYLERRLQAA
jgi:hypothetical protein